MVSDNFTVYLRMERSPALDRLKHFTHTTLYGVPIYTTTRLVFLTFSFSSGSRHIYYSTISTIFPGSSHCQPFDLEAWHSLWF